MTSTASLLSYPTVKGLELNYSPYSNYKLLSINVSDSIDSITSEGYDFAAALNKSNVLSVIKDKFQKEGLSAVIDISKKIAAKQATKLLYE
jgi:hypothetical protein